MDKIYDSGLEVTSVVTNGNGRTTAEERKLQEAPKPLDINLDGVKVRATFCGVPPAELDPHLVTLAAAALQGLLSNDRHMHRNLEANAVRYAKETLKKLKEEQ
jgi:hypothetical protein